MKKEDMHDYDYDRWGTTPGATFSLDNEEEEPVAKTFSEVIEKFNPFHDAAGRFASSNGFKTYSANPNTKAGAMAIARSSAAGHGKTRNVHRQSYGETIDENADWMGNNIPLPPGIGASKVLGATEQHYGLQGASRTGAAWQSQNQAQGRVTGPSKNAQQQAQSKQPKQQQNQQKPAQNQQQTQQQQAQNTPPAKSVHVTRTMRSGAVQDVDFDQSTVKGALNKEFKGTAQGKDLTKSFDATKVIASDNYRGVDRYTNQVADMQGFNAPAKKVSKAEFAQLAKQCGDEFYRTVDKTTIDGKRLSAKQFKEQYTTNDDMKMNGDMGRVYGDGIYTVSAKMGAGRGRTYTQRDAKAADNHSKFYGDGQTTLKMTWLSKPNIVTEGQLHREFSNLSPSERAKFGNHENTYACAKGYDAVYTRSGNYMTVFNRSKIAVCED